MLLHMAARKPQVTSEPQLLTLQQLEREYGPPYTTWYDLVTRGSLPSIRLADTKRIWVRRADAERLIEQSIVQPSEAA